MTEQESRFTRSRMRHRFTAREATVVGVREVAGQYARVSLSGPEFHDFVSTGPTDHARVFFPDPVSGELVAPQAAGPGEDGIVRPQAPMFGRDFTPLNVRTDEATGQRVFDIDILRHEDPGPAAAWAARAGVGDSLVVVGPRGSAGAVEGADRVLLVVDGTSLPAAARWIAATAPEVETLVIADIAGPLDWVREYLREQAGREAPVQAAGEDLVAAVARAGVDDGTFVFAAGEASRLVPLRRWVRGELGLPREQYVFTGYWKRGETAFDHHAPIDPSDPDG